MRLIPGPNGGSVPAVITPSGPEPVQLVAGPNGEPAITGPNGLIPVSAVIGPNGQPLEPGQLSPPQGPVAQPNLNNPNVVPEPVPTGGGYYHSGANGSAKVMATFAALVVAGAAALLV